MTEQQALLSFAPTAWRSKMTLTAGLLGICFLLLGVVRAEAAPITWEWAGPVTGYQCLTAGCAITLDTVVPLGTRVGVFVTLDPVVPTYPNPSIPCLWGNASASLQVLGRTYTNEAFVFIDAYGFSGNCAAPGTFDWVEIVVPSWGGTLPYTGGNPLPGGWEPFGINVSGLWWNGDLTSVQPKGIASQFPDFRLGQGSPQHFTANLQAVQPVPEPSTLFLLSTVLSAAGAKRVFTRGWMKRRPINGVSITRT